MKEEEGREKSNKKGENQILKKKWGKRGRWKKEKAIEHFQLRERVFVCVCVCVSERERGVAGMEILSGKKRYRNGYVYMLLMCEVKVVEIGFKKIRTNNTIERTS
jgi:hypothetical protein